MNIIPDILKAWGGRDNAALFVHGSVGAGTYNGCGDVDLIIVGEGDFSEFLSRVPNPDARVLDFDNFRDRYSDLGEEPNYMRGSLLRWTPVAGPAGLIRECTKIRNEWVFSSRPYDRERGHGQAIYKDSASRRDGWVHTHRALGGTAGIQYAAGIWQIEQGADDPASLPWLPYEVLSAYGTLRSSAVDGYYAKPSPEIEKSLEIGLDWYRRHAC